MPCLLKGGMSEDEVAVLFTVALVGVIFYSAYRSSLKENNNQTGSQASPEPFGTADALKVAIECHKRLPSLIEVLSHVAEERVGTQRTSQIAELMGRMESKSSKFPPPIVALTLISMLISLLEKIQGTSKVSDIQRSVTGLGRVLATLLREEGYAENAVSAQTSQLTKELISAANGFDPALFDLTITIILDHYAEHLTQKISASSGESSGRLSTAESTLLQAVDVSVGEPSRFGSMLGRQCVKNGIALGRTLFLSHGTRASASTVRVFESQDHLSSEGFKPYCTDLLHKPPLEDQSELSRHTRAAGVAFALYCTVTFSGYFKKKQNDELFIAAVGQAIREELGEHDTGITSDLVFHYYGAPIEANLAKRPLLNIEKPGTDDILAVLLEEVNKQFRGGALGFQRRGHLGFDTIAIPLAEETGRAIMQAVDNFGW
jgi:hypothetical protein